MRYGKVLKYSKVHFVVGASKTLALKSQSRQLKKNPSYSTLFIVPLVRTYLLIYLTVHAVFRINGLIYDDAIMIYLGTNGCVHKGTYR